MPLYASPEQLMRERSELARKGIARGRSAIAMAYADGVLLVAENPSTTLHKLSEIYDRIGFCAAGRYSEYESLRRAGIKHVDMWGYAYDRRDVSARQLANVYSQTLSAIFTEQIKPFEVDICVAQVGAAFGEDELYRLTYDGFITHEPYYVVMGGQSETITTTLKDSYEHDMTLEGALGVAMHALSSSTNASGRSNGSEQSTGEDLREKLEVAVLERARPNRAFRRITGAVLAALLPEPEQRDDTADDGGSSETS